jgi:para-nitrobenzyl esterase
MNLKSTSIITQEVVETISGKIRGQFFEGVYSFKGIRYGAPAGDENRFLPPQKPKPWGGVMDAFEFGNSALQTYPKAKGPLLIAFLQEILDAVGGGEIPKESEDCLFLNVWTPGLKDGRKRPVMVWLHGGGFMTGSGSIALYQGDYLVKRGDVVVVTVNHRLNVFGFTHLEDIGGAEYQSSGNLGMLDIIAALEWVRDNISQFGGDPGCVTIFGQSGGGQKVSMLMGAPPAQGLFHRAVIQSGPGVKMLEREQAAKASEVLLAELGLLPSSVNDIKKISVEQLLIAYYRSLKKIGQVPAGFLNAFAPVIDPLVLPEHPFHPTASTVSAQVPLMVGCNRTEMTLFMAPDPAAFSLDEEGMQTRVHRLLGDQSANVIAVYKKANPDYTPSDLYIQIWTDFPTTAFTINIAERKSALHQAPAYLYRFDWETPVLGGKLRSPHTLEIPFVFDNMKDSRELTGGGEDAVTLAGRISEAWIAFAAGGDPNTPKSGLPYWAPYDTKSRATMIFNNESRIVEDPQSKERKVLDDVLRRG